VKVSIQQYKNYLVNNEKKNKNKIYKNNINNINNFIFSFNTIKNIIIFIYICINHIYSIYNKSKTQKKTSLRSNCFFFFFNIH